MGRAERVAAAEGVGTVAGSGIVLGALDHPGAHGIAEKGSDPFLGDPFLVWILDH
jgi:hypothetical protein